jgi:sterol desaturase/sphingolipid hydroxylase (fatty acid hydroxylase superfamily)
MPSLLHIAAEVGSHIAQVLGQVFLAPSSTFSLASLAGALVVATLTIGLGRLRRRGRISARLLRRALTPRRAVFGPSGRADLGWFAFNTLCGGALIGWALLSQGAVAAWTRQGLVALLGPSGIHAAGVWPAALTSVVLYLAFELAYWADHWLSHNVPALWEIHKVHHTAEALSPLTTFRVHPLESLKFYNIVALVTGLAGGLLDYGLGAAHGQLTLLGADVLFLAFMFSFGHLLHSHVWISLPGPLARVLMSPAAHQIHHSTDPQHFGCNLGNALAVWDWAFGTLRVPPKQRAALTFGVAGEGAEAHTITGSLISPMLNAARTLWRRAPNASAVVSPSPRT